MKLWIDDVRPAPEGVQILIFKGVVEIYKLYQFKIHLYMKEKYKG